MANLSMTVNGKAVTATVDPRTLLVQFLRENLRLTGTHVGCDTSQCGACVVHLDGKAVKACTTLALSCEGASVTTIEGLAREATTLRDAFVAEDAIQCGFCTPGQMISASALLAGTPAPTREEIRGALAGNLCRCGAYPKIERAVLRASGQEVS